LYLFALRAFWKKQEKTKQDKKKTGFLLFL